MAHAFTRLIRTENDLRVIRAIRSEDDCLHDTVQNIRTRYQEIANDLQENLDHPTSGRNVVSTVERLRRLSRGIDTFLRAYRSRLTPQQLNHSIDILIRIGRYVVHQDTDLYQAHGVVRPAYASPSTGNPYQRWLSAGRPVEYMEALAQLHNNELGRYWNEILDIATRIANNSESTSAEAQSVLAALQPIYNRMSS